MPAMQTELGCPPGRRRRRRTLAALAILGTLVGHGPFARDSDDARLLTEALMATQLAAARPNHGHGNSLPPPLNVGSEGATVQALAVGS